MKIKYFVRFIVVLFSILSSHTSHAGCPIKISNIAPKIGLASKLVATSNLEMSSCANVSIEDGHISFILNDSNPAVNNGIRSELAIGYPYLEGEVVRYKWEMLIPSKAPPEGKVGKWWIVAQWHDQPDIRQGETWSNFKSQSPPVALFVEKRGDDIGIGLAKAKGVQVMWRKIPTDEWLNIDVVIKWSTQSDGYVNVDISGLSFHNLQEFFTGPNMNNHYHHYFKVGQYRHPDYNISAEVLIKNIEFNKLDQSK